MKTPTSRQIVILLLGIGLVVLLSYLRDALTQWVIPGDESSVPRWYVFVSGAVQSLILVLPGIVVGFFARRKGALLGLLTAFVGSFVVSCIFFMSNSSSASVGLGEMPAILAGFMALAIGPSIFGFVAGAAGELFARGGET